MLRTLWKLRILLVVAALVLVAGGAVAFAAVEGNNSNEPTASSAGAEQNQSANENTEPTATKGTEPTATKGTEPTAIPHTVMSGTITSVDCEAGTITITVDNNGGSFTAQLTSTTVYTLSGQTGACSGLKVGWHVSVEAQQSNGQWVAQHVSQDDSGQSGGSGDGGGKDPTPTPAPKG